MAPTSSSSSLGCGETSVLGLTSHLPVLFCLVISHSRIRSEAWRDHPNTPFTNQYFFKPSVQTSRLLKYFSIFILKNKVKTSITLLFSCSFWQQDLQCWDCQHSQVRDCIRAGLMVTTYLGFLDSVSPDTSPESDYQGRAVSIKQSQQSRS